LRQRCIEEIGREKSTLSIAEGDNEALSDQLDETHLTRRGTRHVGKDALNVQYVVAIALQLSLKLGDQLIQKKTASIMSIDFPNPNHHNPKVLVVDDERIIADSLTMILSNSGYDARAAYSGEMAIEMARNFCPDMLITDVLMPGISGIEAAIKVRELLPACKVLLFSGQAATHNLLETASARGHEFELLTKPVHPTQLIAKMQHVMSD
jgi:CheY-like chemotaxis protein